MFSRRPKLWIAGCLLCLAPPAHATEGASSYYFAGAFGSFLDLDNALAIGLLPRLPNASYVQVGNAAGTGAKAALLSLRERARAREIAHEAGYVELTSYPGFQRRFANSMLFPRTAP